MYITLLVTMYSFYFVLYTDPHPITNCDASVFAAVQFGQNRFNAVLNCHWSLRSIF